MKAKSCSVCGANERLVIPYWDADKGYCSSCCHAMNRKFDVEDSWPPGAPSEGMPGPHMVVGIGIHDRAVRVG